MNIVTYTKAALHSTVSMMYYNIYIKIYKKITNNLKVNKILILIGYYKSHWVVNRKIIWVSIIKISLLILIQIKLCL